MKNKQKDEPKKAKKKDKKGQSPTKQKDFKNTINTLTFLQESDISLSKPLMIKNLSADISK